MAPVLGYDGIHSPSTGTRWDAWFMHWSIPGPIAFTWGFKESSSLALGHTGTLVFSPVTFWPHDPAAETRWDSCTQCWDVLRPPPSGLECAGTYWDPHHGPGTCCAPRTGTTSPHWPHRGSGATASRAVSPFMCGSGCLQSAASLPPPLPPDKPRGRDSVSWAVWKISRLLLWVWDTLATLRTNLSHPPRSLPGTSARSCAALSAP